MRFLIFFCVIFVFVNQTQAQQENLVVNGDFEQPIHVGWSVFGLTDVSIGNSSLGGAGALSAFITGNWTPYGHYGGIQTSPITFHSGANYLVRFNYQVLSDGGFYVVLSEPFRRQQDGRWINDYVVECCATQSNAITKPVETLEFEIRAPTLGTPTFQSRLQIMAVAESSKIQLDNVQIYCLSGCNPSPTPTPTPTSPVPVPTNPPLIPTTPAVIGNAGYSCGAYSCGQVPVPQLPPLIPPTRIPPFIWDGNSGGGDGNGNGNQGGDGSSSGGIRGICVDQENDCIEVLGEEEFLVDGVDVWIGELSENFSTESISVVGGDGNELSTADLSDAITDSNLFSYIKGLYTGGYFGPFQPAVNVLLVLFPFYILLITIQFILPIMGIIIGIIRKTLDLIGQYVPFT
jgi:hypothetical protein